MLKYSRQREMVLKAVSSENIHPTADIIYEKVKRSLPNISLGTVYRNLNLLAEQGMIRKIAMPGGCDRFDQVTEPHYHMICEGCGQVLDIKLDALEHLEKIIAEETGFQVIGADLLIRGYCGACSQRKEKQS